MIDICQSLLLTLKIDLRLDLKNHFSLGFEPSGLLSPRNYLLDLTSVF